MAKQTSPAMGQGKKAFGGATMPSSKGSKKSGPPQKGQGNQGGPAQKGKTPPTNK